MLHKFQTIIITWSNTTSVSSKISGALMWHKSAKIINLTHLWSIPNYKDYTPNGVDWRFFETLINHGAPVHLVLQATPFVRLGISASMKASTKKMSTININWALLFVILYQTPFYINLTCLTMMCNVSSYTHLSRFESLLHIDCGNVLNSVLSMV